jgi:tungstate transport system permease protein
MPALCTKDFITRRHDALSDSFLTAWQLVAAADARLAAIVLAQPAREPGGDPDRLHRRHADRRAAGGRPLPGRRALIVLFNGLMGLPPVVVGLLVYLLLSRAGPLGQFGLLFSPAAMIIAQAILVTPIVAALTRQVVADEWSEYREQLRSLGASRTRAAATLLWDGRFHCPRRRWPASAAPSPRSAR